MTPTAVLFPGQGSLTPDSAAHARDVRPELVERACALVGDDPFERAAESTRYAQPATFVASLAGWSEREEELDDVVAMAGHSLGELPALVAAGALRAEDGLRLVVLRGRLMADAAQAAAAGGMVALLGGEPDAAAALAARHGLTLANDNAPGQAVLSGPRAAIERLVGEARSEGFKTIVLDVALFLDLAKRAGFSGIQEWLSFYFKSPMHAPELYPEHDLFIQLMKLKNTLRHMRGEELITHLGREYYD